MLTATELEDLMMNLVESQDAMGVVAILIHRPGDSVELMAALKEDIDDLPGKLRRLADAVEQGGGDGVGRHLHKITPDRK